MIRGLIVAVDYVLAIALMGGFAAIAHAKWVEQKQTAILGDVAVKAAKTAGLPKDKKDGPAAPPAAEAKPLVPEGIPGIVKAMGNVLLHDRNAQALFLGSTVLLLFGSLLNRRTIRLVRGEAQARENPGPRERPYAPEPRPAQRRPSARTVPAEEPEEEPAADAESEPDEEEEAT